MVPSASICMRRVRSRCWGMYFVTFSVFGSTLPTMPSLTICGRHFRDLGVGPRLGIETGQPASRPDGPVRMRGYGVLAPVVLVLGPLLCLRIEASELLRAGHGDPNGPVGRRHR